MSYKAINPATNELIAEHEEISEGELEEKLSKSQEAFLSWRNSSFAARQAVLSKAAAILEKRAQEFGELMTVEMGKPISQGTAEAKKCAWVCRYYAENGEEFLHDSMRESDGSSAWVSYEPLGVIFAVMPWNFPFWQVFRFAAPTLMAGNVGLLKHASNVPQCAMAIEETFREAGAPEGVFANLLLGAKRVQGVIEDERVKAVSITGSTPAGMKVAEAAGKVLKPAVLELGGSDPFIVLADANIKEAAKTAAAARCLNTGQSCIAAKRFIVEETIAEEFTGLFVSEMENQTLGDPIKEDTKLGPMARIDLRDELAEQVARSVSAGAKLLLGGEVPNRPGAWYPATVLAEVKPGMPAADEELFGPVGAVLKVKDEQEAIQRANTTEFGLGASLWTEDKEKAKQLIPQIEAGAVFVNGLVKSDPRLPFGGVKMSGFGRELSREGILEFVNQKTVWVR